MDANQKARELLAEAIGRPVDFLDTFGDGFCITKDEALRAITRALAQQPEGWRSIETAPKDGTRVLICHTGWYSPVVGRFELREWLDDEQMVRLPTHWMPLPAAPEPGEG